MNIALLGSDPELVALAEAAVAARHSITHFAEPGENSVEFTRLAVPDAAETSWETLLDRSAADFVFVGRGGADDERRADQLRRLATEGVSLLVVHPVVAKLLVYYEIDMIARDAGGSLRHFVPDKGHPAVDRISELLDTAEQPIGQIESVTFQRRMSDRSPDAVTGQFARDVEILRLLHPGLRKLLALGADATPASYASLAVQLSGPDGPPIRWSVVRGFPETDADAVITVAGSRGSAILTIADDRSWQMTTDLSGGANNGRTEREVDRFEPFDSAHHAVSQLESTTGVSERPDSTWPDAIRAMELADSIEISLRRGRAIEVPLQEVTETTLFRGRMATFGCGLVLLGPLILVVAGVFGDTFRIPLFQYWPFVLLAGLVVFLALQLAPKLLYKPNSERETDRHRRAQ